MGGAGCKRGREGNNDSIEGAWSSYLCQNQQKALRERADPTEAISERFCEKNGLCEVLGMRAGIA